MSPLRNTIIHGNCIDVMQALPPRSADFILTDPPYLAAYKSRDNQTILNDDNAAWLTRSFAQMYRILKNDACAVSFYGWPKVDLFFAAWKSAGFRIGGHIVFRKRYASKTAFLQYRHEAAYLLIKGNPAFPAAPLPDVMDWTYTGNKLHPTQTVPVEHVPDVDKKRSIFRAAKQEFLVQKLAQTALIGTVVQILDVLARPLKAQLNFIRVGFFTDLVIDNLEYREASLGKTGGLFETAQKQLYKTLLGHFLEFIRIRASPAKYLARTPSITNPRCSFPIRVRRVRLMSSLARMLGFVV